MSTSSSTSNAATGSTVNNVPQLPTAQEIADFFGFQISQLQDWFAATGIDLSDVYAHMIQFIG